MCTCNWVSFLNPCESCNLDGVRDWRPFLAHKAPSHWKSGLNGSILCDMLHAWKISTYYYTIELVESRIEYRYLFHFSSRAVKICCYRVESLCDRVGCWLNLFVVVLSLNRITNQHIVPVAITTDTHIVETIHGYYLQPFT